MLPTITMAARAVEDPELRFTPSGVAVCRMRVAASERIQDRTTNEWKDGDACFLTLELWRQPAENVAETVRRGMGLLITGKLRQRSYETKEGEKRTVYEMKDPIIGVDLTWATAVVTKVARTQQGAPAVPAQGGPQSAPDAPAAPAAASTQADPYNPPF